MNTLYIDTHNAKIILAFYQNGKLVKRTEETGEQQSSIIMVLLDNLLKELGLTVHDISEIIVINGPGSFTGVRLGVTIAKTLAYTLHVPIKVMSSILIKAISNVDKGHHWFVEAEKNGYYVGEFNDFDELLNDYFYIKKTEYEDFRASHDVIEDVPIDYQSVYDYSKELQPFHAHSVNPLYVKLIEVQK